MGRRSWFAEHAGALVGLGVGVVVVAGGSYALVKRRERRDTHGPGVISDAIVVEANGALVLTEYVEHADEHSDWRNWRLSVVDARTGAVRRREQLEDSRAIRCDLAAPDRIWCVHEGRLELRDAATLAVLTDDQRLRASPGLGAALMVDRMLIVDRKTWSLEVTTADGYVVAIDARSLAVTRLEKQGTTGPSRRVLAGSRGGGCTSARLAQAPQEELALTGSPRARLYRRRPGAAAGQGAALGERTYLAGKILCDDWTALEVRPSTFVVSETTSLDEKVARTRFTAVDAAGREVWTVEDGPGTIDAVGLAGDALVITRKGATSHVLGVHPETGAVLYRYDGAR